MKGILSEAGRQILEQFAWSNVLLAFDYDGTLAPIVADREHASMRPRTRELLGELAGHYPIVVISGRTQADVARRLKGTGVCDVVGNHGIEPWKATDDVLKTVRRWRPVLNDRLACLRGVQIEDKGFSVAIHYRLSREKRRARAAILEAAAELRGIRVIGGKQVINILPRHAPHKGLALERERERLGCDTAVYVGDDETDEDVFNLDQPGRLLTIRVGSNQASRADFCIGSQRQIDTLIRALITLRSTYRRTKRARA